MTKETVHIPVIDISISNCNAASEMLAAAAMYGFVFVKNNEAARMPTKDIDEMFDLVGLFLSYSFGRGKNSTLTSDNRVSGSSRAL